MADRSLSFSQPNGWRDYTANSECVADFDVRNYRASEIPRMKGLGAYAKKRAGGCGAVVGDHNFFAPRAAFAHDNRDKREFCCADT
jgi:hypothetical protein